MLVLGGMADEGYRQVTPEGYYIYGVCKMKDSRSTWLTTFIGRAEALYGGTGTPARETTVYQRLGRVDPNHGKPTRTF